MQREKEEYSVKKGSSSKFSSKPATTFYQTKAPPARYGQHRNNAKPRWKDRTCFNCGERGHILKYCRHPMDSLAIAVRKVQLYQKSGKFGDRSKALKRVLYELCDQIDQQSDLEDTDTFFNDAEHSESDQDSNASESDDDNAAIYGTNYLDTFYTNLDAYTSAAVLDFSDDTSPRRMLQNKLMSAPKGIAHKLKRQCKRMLNCFKVSKAALDATESSEFNGGCLDIVAQRTVIGLPQTQTYCQNYGSNSYSCPTRSSSQTQCECHHLQCPITSRFGFYGR
ncbi:hypothetical protein FGB62_70g112 [Gracilaria domingensis]|nr:hypothetical protein FGB62_70g112 [Gracilaria domingensis]